jgi:hypothetical protein
MAYDLNSGLCNKVNRIDRGAKKKGFVLSSFCRLVASSFRRDGVIT